MKHISKTLALFIALCMLLSLGEKELNDMIAEQHGAEVDCHFCNTVRRFSEGDLRALVERLHSEGKADV